MNLNQPMALGAMQVADVGSWPLALKLPCFALVIAATLAAGYLLVLQGQRGDLAAAGRAEQGLHLERSAHQGLIDSAGDAREGERRAALALAAAIHGLPTAAELPTLLEEVTRAAEASGLVLERVELGDDRPLDFYVELPLTVAVSGDFHQFGAFAGAVGALPHLVVLGDFAIERGDDGLTMTVAARSYRYTGAAPMLAAGDGPPPPTGFRFEYAGGDWRSPFAPFAAPSRLPPPAEHATHPLAQYPLAQLRMVGTLAGRGVLHALVRDPSGHIHRVAVGDMLGAELARVRALGATEIRLDALDVDGTHRQATLALQQAEPAAEAAPEEEQE